MSILVLLPTLSPSWEKAGYKFYYKQTNKHSCADTLIANVYLAIFKNILIILHDNLLPTLYRCVFYSYLEFNSIVSEEVHLYMEAYTMNKTFVSMKILATEIT